jgi:hypothetical protein
MYNNTLLDTKILKIKKYLLYIRYTLNNNRVDNYDYMIILLINLLELNNIDEFLVKYDEFIVNIEDLDYTKMSIYTYKLRKQVRDFLLLDENNNLIDNE